jgi:AcrR family transcriptional regulator
MLEEGYAAVGTRRAAEIAGVSPTLIHYYYPTTDDLFVGLYRHTSKQDLEGLKRALASEDPVAALWHHQTHLARAALAVEFLAAANHRKVIKSEIIRYSEYSRSLQAKAVSRICKATAMSPATCPPLCLTTLIASVARTLIMEAGVGISLGHAETRTFVELMLAQLKNG